MPTELARYWRHAAVPGVDLLRARYVTHRYRRHAHETYTVGVIESGVEEFHYGGALLRAGPGAVALLNPEVVHTGQAGVPEGWSYRVLYPAVGLVAGIAADLGGAGGTPVFRADGDRRPALRAAAAVGAPGRRARRPARVVQPAARGAGRHPDRACEPRRCPGPAAGAPLFIGRGPRGTR